ncbi:hypothetical protein ERX35_011015 [Macrococcus equipercicus]|uniref:Uncharacterized protein n=1 Tax=Macrococcus equipercicus TaxID=69967 RepID=A0ABQ6R644_9STAP|nr:hypothetical protein [Macrococcus equipercicus]KAA1035777.1 hypothetical protein ERX35_011015 [Macrococcus equipercicus]
MVPRESNTDWSKNENLTNNLNNNNQDSHLAQQVEQLTLKYQKAEIAFNSMRDKYLTLVSEIQAMKEHNENLEQEMNTAINENKALKTELQKTIQLSQNKIDNMTEVDLNAKKLKQTVLTDIKRDLKSEMDSYQQELDKGYLKSNIFLNYVPVIISLIFVMFIIYYLVIGMH